MRPQVLLNQVKHFMLVRLGQLFRILKVRKWLALAQTGPLVGPTQQGKMFRFTWRLSLEFGSSTR